MALLIVFNDSENDPTIVEIGTSCQIVMADSLNDGEGPDDFWKSVDMATVATLHNNVGDFLTVSPGVNANGQLMIDF